jgi:hypothetical protein
MRPLIRKIGAKLTPRSFRHRGLLRRVERMKKVMSMMADRAFEKNPAGMAKLASSPELKEQFNLLETLSEEQLSEFLDMLEAGAPEEYKHLLR